uniref:HAT C-terminal dimerisation domain-containing protein n=1 Tax=Amphiprion ocellaris TaxID=80972 RepID=A0A3Q1C081_AMPOC
MCFLADLSKHLHNLNLGLQGRDKTVIDLVAQTRAFQVKLNMFAMDLIAGRMLHFPTLRKRNPPPKVTAAMTDLVAQLKENFASQLDGLAVPTEAMHFTKDPFAVVPEENLSNRAKESSLTMPQELCANGPAAFWSHVNVHQFPNLKKLAVTVLSMFGSTYVCESSFSHMNAIKTNLRCSLHDSTLQNCLRIALTTYEPNSVDMQQVEESNTYYEQKHECLSVRPGQSINSAISA